MFIRSKDFGNLDGKEMFVYNVHGLIRLIKEVSKFGSLDNFSAFVFESDFGKLQCLMKKPNFPLQQVIRRLSKRHAYNPEYRCS